MTDSYTQKEFENRFTKTSDSIKYISELESLDLTSISDEQLEEKIDTYFHLFPYTSSIIPVGSELFRARLNIGELPFYEVKDIYAPAIDLISNYGRANRPNERVFYSASNFKLASFEVVQNYKNIYSHKGQVAFLTIGIWKVKEELHLANIIHSPILHDLRNDILDAFNKNKKLLSNGTLKDDNVNAANMILQFFSDQYTKEKIKSGHDYKISAFYAHRLNIGNEFIANEYQSDKFDGINYPSVALKFKGDNQALFIKSADEKLEIINAFQVLCTNFDFDNGEFLSGVVYEAESITDGLIKWKSEFYKSDLK
jgi:hypothetical protein